MIKFPFFSKKEKTEDREIDFVVGLRDLKKENTKKSFVKPVTKKIYNKIKQVLRINRTYLEIVAPPLDLNEIRNCIDVDGFLRRARDRYVELIWKNGFGFTGPNQRARQYIQTRFDQVSRVTGKPTEELFDKIAETLVGYYNCFIIKIRNDKASGGSNRITFYGKELKPVAGYFIAEPTRMIAQRDPKNKRIKYWENFDSNGKIVGRYPPEDVIHITLNRKSYEIFGTPAAVNVLDDVRALRRMEENVEILVFQHAIPLYQYKVGTDQEGPEEGEVDAVKYEIDNMVVHGMLVTDGRHEVKAVGVRGEALDIDKYLEYFRERILVGLSQSNASMGIGAVSRASMGTVNKHVLDAAGRFQRRIKSYVEQFMINELLEEGGFDSFDEKNKVELFIPEIDLDDKIRKEFHTSSLWQANLISEDEARQDIGRDPMKQTDFQKTFFSRITIPKIEAEARAKAAAAAASAGTGEGERIGAPGNSAEAEQKAMPRNQFGTKRISGPAKRGTDVYHLEQIKDFTEEYKEILYNQIDAAHSDILLAMKDKAVDPFSANMGVSHDISIENTSKLLIDIFEKALLDVESKTTVVNYADFLATIHKENGKIIQNFYKSTTLLLESYGVDQDPGYVFEGMAFKIDLMSSWIVQKTYWLGVALAHKDSGSKDINIIKNGIELENFNLDNVNFDTVHPYDYVSLYKAEIV